MLRESAIDSLIFFSPPSQMGSLSISEENMINGNDDEGGGGSKTDVRNNIKLIGHITQEDDFRRLFNLYEEDGGPMR